MSKALSRFVNGWNNGVKRPPPMPELREFVTQSVWESFTKQFTTDTDSKTNLPRASELGKPALLSAAKWLGFVDDSNVKRPMSGAWIFSIGDYFETVLLATLALHDNDVTHLQEEVDFFGAKGHKDAHVNGRLVEIKTMSDYYWRKFVDEQDDERGYLTQLHIYAYCSGTQDASWLCLNKQTNELIEIELAWDEEYIERAKYILDSLPFIESIEDIKKFFDVPKPVFNRTRRRYELPWVLRDCPLKSHFYPLEADGYTVIT